MKKVIIATVIAFTGSVSAANMDSVAQGMGITKACYSEGLLSSSYSDVLRFEQIVLSAARQQGASESRMKSISDEYERKSKTVSHTNEFKEMCRNVDRNLRNR